MSALEKHFHGQEIEPACDREIARVLECSPKDYFAILQISPLLGHASVVSTLRKSYRRKSLLIHPDKAKNKDAARAFDLLRKANLVLATGPRIEHAKHESKSAGADDEHEKSRLEEEARYTEREHLVLIYAQVANGLGVSVEEDFNHDSNRAIREKVRLVLDQHEKDQEVEKAFLQWQEVKRQSELNIAANGRDLKRSWQSRWEQDRDNRVQLWRKFSAKVEKRKKQKKVLV